MEAKEDFVDGEIDDSEPVTADQLLMTSGELPSSCHVQDEPFLLHLFHVQFEPMVVQGHEHVHLGLAGCDALIGDIELVAGVPTLD